MTAINSFEEVMVINSSYYCEYDSHLCIFSDNVVRYRTPHHCFTTLPILASAVPGSDPMLRPALTPLVGESLQFTMSGSAGRYWPYWLEYIAHWGRSVLGIDWNCVQIILYAYLGVRWDTLVYYHIAKKDTLKYCWSYRIPAQLVLLRSAPTESAW